ncbi:hypothetical protein JQ631_07940 [Bradyrhizobium manausense]|uniref:hypothetical protein n=1 Tax=Bradyrhizobium manausense TaxID=989370 RepID=UPI001BAA364D|nr:hypothetical protein [Bradyrhizobium manausense]MBR0788997.1 hypothetical protein [Bradyrhizobium manausense]
MIKSPEWKAITVAATIACVSIFLLAVDAGLDLNVSGLAQRLESAQASFVDTMGQYQLAFAVPTWARGRTPAEQPCPAISADRQPLTLDCPEHTGSLADQ